MSADVISFTQVVHDRRRARERATMEACVQILEANLRLALHLFSTAPASERPLRARQLRQMSELLEYAARAS